VVKPQDDTKDEVIRNMRYLFFFLLPAIACILLAARVQAGVVYYHSDHLGSASVLTDSAGTIAGEMQYYPYGEIFLSTTDSSASYLYTDKENDGETELYYYGARYYDPHLSAFLSIDPMLGTVNLPRFLNPYSPMINNPVRLIDPDGRLPIDANSPWVPQRLNLSLLRKAGAEIDALQIQLSSFYSESNFLHGMLDITEFGDEKVIYMEQARKTSNFKLALEASINKVDNIEIPRTRLALNIMKDQYEGLKLKHRNLTKAAMKGRLGVFLTALGIATSASKDASAMENVKDLTLSGISFAAGPLGVVCDLLFFPNEMGDSTLDYDFDPEWKVEPHEGPIDLNIDSNYGSIELDLGGGDNYFPLYDNDN